MDDKNMKFNEPNPFEVTAKSKVKLVKNTKGVNWEIGVVKGEEHLLEGLMQAALNIHTLLKEKLKDELNKKVKKDERNKKT